MKILIDSSRKRSLRPGPPALVGAAALLAGVLAAGAAQAQACFPSSMTGRALSRFSATPDGNSPVGGLVFREGALFGVTGYGGGNNYGMVFRVSPPVPPATQWTRNALHWFGGAGDGIWPASNLIADSSGALYGVTYGGDVPSGLGTIYKLTPPVSGNIWTKRILYVFRGDADGSRPSGGLVFDSAGALYGTTQGGRGAVFRLSPPVPPATGWTLSVLYRFLGGTDGSMPTGNLLLRNGELFGVTHDLGDTGPGTIFRLSPPVAPATAWTKTTIHRFPSLGAGSWALPGNLVFDTAGSLYVATQGGGANRLGAVYKLTRSIWPEWTPTTLYSFRGAPDGASPAVGQNSALVFDSAGALYGVTSFGGAEGAGFGAVYKLAPPVPPQTAWTESLVYSFKGGSDGAQPNSGLLFDTNGAIYGTTAAGGSEGKGVVFRLSR